MGGGGAPPDFFFCSLFLVQQTMSGIGHRVKYGSFFGLVTSTLNVRNNNDGFLPDIILLTQCYYRRGTRFNAIKRFRICSL